MSDLRIERVDGDAMLLDWRRVHNTIIPTAVLSLAEVTERAGRNLLAVAYLDDVAVGCSTVRPPADGASVATVIARVLPDHRGQGFGGQLYARGLAEARALGADVIETCVLASNPEGLRFALGHGFVETDRYVLPGDSVPFVDLRLA
ncbi:MULTISPECIES: GNAT family N-acetyltransferase [unclassified Streptomyces]|uniref:GNAT family N-acetyltransferase n=1 Tax=unclassified Streptomyces TaxID=2593676 RepID=UPI0025545682|nr:MULTISPECIES: GNAT family N-acetyltransferase [unclassified Streptomyces]WRZ62848.1 GNAT family N-acetyltransferase [Streptomyces sp. NBC_01257]WSU56815.1 GNAT family N-acetyltransferase [Streptomyces sp. NBC_01104]